MKQLAIVVVLIVICLCCYMTYEFIWRKVKPITDRGEEYSINIEKRVIALAKRVETLEEPVIDACPVGPPKRLIEEFTSTYADTITDKYRPLSDTALQRLKSSQVPPKARCISNSSPDDFLDDDLAIRQLSSPAMNRYLTPDRPGRRDKKSPDQTSELHRRISRRLSESQRAYEILSLSDQISPLI